MRLNPPKIIAIFITSVGIMDIVSAIVPSSLDRWKVIRDILPIEIIHTSRSLTLIAGIFLFSLGRALWVQKNRAWKLAVFTLFSTIIFHVLKGLDYEEFIISSIALLILWYYRRLYYVSSGRTAIKTAVYRSLGIIVLLFAYQYGGSNLLHLSARYSHWFISSLSFISVVGVISAIFVLFEPALESNKPSDDDTARLIDLLDSTHTNSASFFALMDDKTLWFDENRSHLIAYKKVGNYVVVLGEPIGEENEVGTMWQYKKYIESRGCHTIFYNMQDKELSASLQMTPIKIGEDAVIDLSDFTLDSAKLKDIRNCVKKIDKYQISYSWYNMSEIPWRELQQIIKIYDSWQSRKGNYSLTFSLGFFPFPVLGDAKVLLAKNAGGEVLSVLSFFPYNHKLSYCIDLMIRSSQAPNGIIESSIVSAIDYFNNLGVKELNLGMAPLSNIEFLSNNKITESIRNMLMTQFNKFYGYKSLANFKNKFAPRWVPKYIYIDSVAQLSQSLLAIASAHRK